MYHKFRSKVRWSNWVAFGWLVVVAMGLAAEPVRCFGCWGCDSARMTRSEEIAASAVAVICRLVSRPDAATVPEGEAPECTFEVLEFLTGEATLAAQPGATKPYRIRILFAGEQPLGSTFLAFAVAPPNLLWGTPTPVNEREIAYLRKLPSLPEKRPERLAMFYDYLESPDVALAIDAYEEFARATYVELAATKDIIPRAKILGWIQDVNVLTAHRRQYLSMLSACDTAADLPAIEALIRSDDRTARSVLDALIGCYLVLRGPDGLPLIEQLFLRNTEAEFIDVDSAIRALRFLAQETDALPRDRITAALRAVLEQPKMADLVVPDLTRRQDWSVAPKLAALYRRAEADGVLWARVPIANYFRICPTPEAAALRTELEKLDPEPFRRAEKMYGNLATVPAAQESTDPVDATK